MMCQPESTETDSPKMSGRENIHQCNNGQKENSSKSFKKNTTVLQWFTG